MSIQGRIYILLCLTLAVFAGVLSIPRIPQDPQYHFFADSRSIFGIPNFFNVTSNLPFLIAGIWGLMCLLSGKHAAAFRENHERWPYIFFFLGFVLTCVGSAYYHWSPENRTLVWDRLPMAVVCMGILAGTMNDRIGVRAGTLCLGPLLMFGLFSVAYWYASELKGSGDLRLYGIVQFYSLMALAFLLLFFPARYTHSGWLIAGGAVYLASKVLEMLDGQIFSFAKISGHTLKHLAASLAAFCILRMLKERDFIDSPKPLEQGK